MSHEDSPKHTFTAGKLKDSEVETLEKAFKLFHIKNDKGVDGAELGVILRSLERDIKDQDIEQLMAEADTDGDGVVLFSEFVNILEKNRSCFKSFAVESVEGRILEIKKADIFNKSLETHFPGIMGESEYAQALVEALAPFGFVGDNTIAAVSTCRDEICKPLVECMSKTWGQAFDLASLAGMVFLGTTGMNAALHHAPEVKGKERFLFLGCPHIAVDAFGEVGPIFRPGRLKKSNACGALCAFLAEIASGKIKSGLDMNDIEYSLMKQRLLDNIPYGSKPTLVELTKVAMTVIQKDLERLIAKKISVEHADYVVAIGIQVHGPHWLNRNGDMDYVWPTTHYVVVDGKRHEIKLQKPSKVELGEEALEALETVFTALYKKKEGKASGALALEYGVKIATKAKVPKDRVTKATEEMSAEKNVTFLVWKRFFSTLAIPNATLVECLKSTPLD